MTASTEVRVPFRPRLADHVMIRRQVIDGAVKPCLFDSRTGTVYFLTEEELEHVLCLDGTRDFGGVLLAAVQRKHYRRASEIQQLIGQMAEAGLLVDGIAPPAPAPLRHLERPLEPLPGYRLHCEALGSCCTTFASVPFSREEMQRATAVAPERVPEPQDRVFLPLWGSVDRSSVTVSMTDGQCPFLSTDALCIIHERAGAEAKPLACRVFPKGYVDDGEAIRIAPRVECPCIVASALREEAEGEPLVAEGTRTEGDLDPRIHVVRLPERVRLTATEDAPRSALRGWSQAIAEARIRDGVAACIHLAEAVERHGLDADAAREAATSATAPSLDRFRAPLAALAKVAAMRLESSATRREDDRIRVLAEWTHAAASALADDTNVLERLQAVPSPEREAFYLRAVAWGHQLAQERGALVTALQDRGIRLLLSRQMPFSLTPAAERDPAAGYPITAVEAMMRGRALERYVDLWDSG